MTQTKERTPHDFLNRDVLRQIDYRVARLGRKYGLDLHDRRDVRQEFCLALFRAGTAYDVSRGSPERFVRMVLNRCYKSFVRKTARATQNRVRSVGAVAMDTSDPEYESQLVDPRSGHSRKRFELAEDVRVVISRLPADLAELCRDLMSLTPPQVARKRGVHHSTIYRALFRLREHFQNAGLGEEF